MRILLLAILIVMGLASAAQVAWPRPDVIGEVVCTNYFTRSFECKFKPNIDDLYKYELLLLLDEGSSSTCNRSRISDGDFRELFSCTDPAIIYREQYHLEISAIHLPTGQFYQKKELNFAFASIVKFEEPSNLTYDAETNTVSWATPESIATSPKAAMLPPFHFKLYLDEYYARRGIRFDGSVGIIPADILLASSKVNSMKLPMLKMSQDYLIDVSIVVAPIGAVDYDINAPGRSQNGIKFTAKHGSTSIGLQTFEVLSENQSHRTVCFYWQVNETSHGIVKSIQLRTGQDVILAKQPALGEFYFTAENLSPDLAYDFEIHRFNETTKQNFLETIHLPVAKDILSDYISDIKMGRSNTVVTLALNKSTVVDFANHSLVWCYYNSHSGECTGQIYSAPTTDSTITLMRDDYSRVSVDRDRMKFGTVINSRHSTSGIHWDECLSYLLPADHAYVRADTEATATSIRVQLNFHCYQDQWRVPIEYYVKYCPVNGCWIYEKSRFENSVTTLHNLEPDTVYELNIGLLWDLPTQAAIKLQVATTKN